MYWIELEIEIKRYDRSWLVWWWGISILTTSTTYQNFLLNFSLWIFMSSLWKLLVTVPSFSLCEFFSCCFCKVLHFQISSSSAVDFNDAHLLFLFECVIISTLQGSVRKNCYVRLCTYKNLSHEVLFWLRDIFVSNLLRKRCLQAKFYQNRGKQICQR